MATVRAYIGLGANVGDARATLSAAIDALSALPGTTLMGVSSLYVTAPIGITDQPDFHNAVVALEVPAGSAGGTGAIALLLGLKSLERAFGRIQRVRNGPRELDLDLLIFGDAHLSVERPPEGRSIDPAKAGATKFLEIPHPKANLRLFVLAPLSELAPILVPPGWDETVEQARARRLAIEGDGAVRCVGRWDPLEHAWV